MPIAAVVAESRDLKSLVPWAFALAHAHSDSLSLVLLKKDENRSKDWSQVSFEEETDQDFHLLVELRDWLSELQDLPGSTADNTASPDLEVFVLTDSEPEKELGNQLPQLSASLLILPAFLPERKGKYDAWQMQLYRTFSGDTVLLRDDTHQNFSGLRILNILRDDQDDELALKTAIRLSRLTEGTIEATYFEPDIGSVAQQVGRRVLDRLIESRLPSEQASAVNRRVLIAENFSQGLQKISLSNYDLVLIGTRDLKSVSKVLRANLKTENCEETGKPLPLPAIALMRCRHSFQNRIVTWIRDRLNRAIPQLDRNQRISLFDRIQSSSQWNFDFVFLIFLSTLIASLGLFKDSVAVVIGAMLVAPLMTPIVGIGLGLTQSNIRLIRDAGRTVLLGFATAIFVSLLVGLVVSIEPTAEMRQREYPDFSDWLIALGSGMAAAYAMGRPNLLSALPGVAIATALVPPIATAGMALATGHWHLAGGALLLFSTNIVAIVLGTTFTFWSVGLTPAKDDERTQPKWPVLTFLALVVLALILTLLMEMNAGF